MNLPAALYGFGAKETLVGKVLTPHRHKFTLASKCGMQGVDIASLINEQSVQGARYNAQSAFEVDTETY